MVHRACARADIERVGSSNGLGQPCLCPLYGCGKIMTPGEAGGDGAGQRATGAVGVPGVDEGGRKPMRLARVVDEQISRVATLRMPAL